MTYLLHGSVYGLPLQPAPAMAALERWQQVGFAETAVSIITEAQTLSSLYLSGSDRQFLYYQNTIRDRVTVLGVDEPVARLYARLRARWQRAGRRINDPDLFVAATAMAHGLIVATLGRDAFAARDEVAWEDWSEAAYAPVAAEAACGLTRRTM
jgi:predicted nucleic acid-binding protein